MKGLILAAGRGSRMEELTLDRPKCLLEVNGKSLLELQLDALHLGGVDEVGIITGYRREMLIRPEVVEFHNPRWATTQMVASLMCAHEWLEAEPCIVSYSDIFYEPQLVRDLVECTAQLAVAYDPNWRELWERRFSDPLDDAETFRLDRNGKLLDIGGNPETVDEIQGQFMGLLRFAPTGWREFTRTYQGAGEDADQLDMTSTLRRLLGEGRMVVSAVPYVGTRWGEVDSAKDLAVYQSLEKL